MGFSDCRRRALTFKPLTRGPCNTLRPVDPNRADSRSTSKPLRIRPNLKSRKQKGVPPARGGLFQLARRKHLFLMLQTDSKLLRREPAARNTQRNDGSFRAPKSQHIAC